MPQKYQWNRTGLAQKKLVSLVSFVSKFYSKWTNKYGKVSTLKTIFIQGGLSI